MYENSARHPLARSRCAKLGSGAGRPSRARPRCFGESPSFQPYHPAPNVLPTILHTIMKTERGVKDSSTRAHDHAQLASSSFRPSYTHRSTPFSPRALSLTISNHDWRHHLPPYSSKLHIMGQHPPALHLVTPQPPPSVNLTLLSLNFP